MCMRANLSRGDRAVPKPNVPSTFRSSWKHCPYNFGTIHHMDADIATIAALIGEPTRAHMLLALLGGVALPAGN